ncbi:MAG: hypothetical protein KJ578_08560 [Bacteroidetes bacterium]|jgi:hypothetical protein|nr:hypothetical protein [Bacteroidota bacterium]MBU1580914.1 hypothetical protein [Bacteroidota bacterium]MBU2466060.1 hypothetical protein [Bacteroidota bacterium]MBU2557813.1 hypothetical protein [Bacteroidota bacterium]MDA3943617.1 DUF5683 domain-containing protein [Bacteroidota bacterium]
MKRFVVLFLGLLVLIPLLNAQEPELQQAKPPHSPHKATIYSALLPGLGQAYNKKYWKIPIVYAGFGTLYYFASSNGKLYREARTAYDYVVNEYEYPIDNQFVNGVYSAEDLQSIKDFYRRNMELSWIITGLWYVLNIVDATVDAHFFDYDISDDLTVQIEPMSQPVKIPAPQGLGYAHQTGITLRLRF